MSSPPAELALNYHPAQPPSSSSSSTTSPSPLIVLIHGGALSSRMYRTTIPHLSARGFDTAAPDLPGHGASIDFGPFSFARSRTLLSAALREHRAAHPGQQVVLVGVSLGGQVVLDLLAHEPDLAAAAVVSGVPIGPPDETAGWEMPRMPTDEEWLRVIGEDVAVVGMENAQGIQAASFGFEFEFDSSAGETVLPPVLVVVGEHDVAMARRDFETLVQRVASAGAADGGKGRREVLEGAWHNHPIDVPERFVGLVADWVGEVFKGNR